MKRSNIFATAALLVTAASWGLSYSAQAEAMKSMAPLFFVFLRYLLGALILLPAVMYMRQKPAKNLLTGVSSADSVWQAVKYFSSSGSFTPLQARRDF